MDHETIELACIGVAALALLMQTVILFALYRGVNKAAQSMKNDIEDLRSSVTPILETTRQVAGTTRELVVRLTPKVEATVTDVAELVRGLRAQAADVEAATEEILARVRRQTGRIDTMFSGTLDAVDKASAFVSEAVGKPVRQLSGLLAGLRAVVESLQASDRSYREPTLQDDKDMFV
jgi:uncharacterized protein YoxC